MNSATKPIDDTNSSTAVGCKQRNMGEEKHKIETTELYFL